MRSTCRVTPGRSETSPNAARRVSVRKSEVLPAFVWPTTAIRKADGAADEPDADACAGASGGVLMEAGAVMGEIGRAHV